MVAHSEFDRANAGSHRFARQDSGRRLQGDARRRAGGFFGRNAREHRVRPPHPAATQGCERPGSTKLLRELCQPDDAGERTLEMAMRRLGLSARAHDRILKVARQPCVARWPAVSESGAR